MARCALAQACSPPTLTSWLWPTWRFWTTDADREIPTDRLEALCDAAGVPPETLEAAALAPIARRVSGERSNGQASWPWIVTRGGRGRRGPGRLYCPECLAESQVPYFRISWRLAWHTGCIKHDRMLIGRCPECGRPQQLHHLPLRTRHVATCAACGADLRRAAPSPGRADAFMFQQAADQAIKNGAAQCFTEAVGTAVWFRMADFLCGLVRRASRSPADGLAQVLSAAGIECPIRLGASPGRRIEHLDVEERQSVLGAVGRIMKLHRNVVQETLMTAGISRQAWRGDRETVPEPFVDLMTALPDHSRPDRRRPRKRPAGPRPRHEVRQMMKGIERKLENTTQ